MSENNSYFIDPLSSSEIVVNLATNVVIKDDGIQLMAQKLKDDIESNKYSTHVWKEHVLHPKVADKSTIDWIFVVDSLNFSFWPNPRHEYTIEGQVGYWALCAAINRALDKGIAITDPKYYSQISEEDFKQIFATDNGFEIPLLKERLQVLRESGRVLIEKFGGSFVNCIEICDSKATNLLKLIVNNFESFRDQTLYKGYKVSFYKRAQILISDIWAAFEGQGFGHFYDINDLTMFADYRIPQVLAHFNVIEYSQQLRDLLKDENHLLKSGNEYEVEIRAASVVAVHRIQQKIRDLDNTSINSIIIDFYLWDYRRNNAKQIDESTPFHRVRHIYY
ncbi:queuosine salvage protein-like [Oppia nitens]|uniref:queuosine salvage protein-like n=1 Tax=Oppia nitens TaxID=1686743 RepID=UPI0023DAD5E1|nr:queuosine salvage protein-like [Oppia nitens]